MSCTSSEQDGDVDTSGELTPTLEDPLGVRSSRLPSLSGSSGDEQELRGATTGEVHLTGNQGFAVGKDTGSPGPSSLLRIRSQLHNLRRTVRAMRLRETTMRRRLRGFEAVQTRLTAAVESVQSELSACFVRRRVSQHECLHVKTRDLEKRVEERLHEAHTMQLALSGLVVVASVFIFWFLLGVLCEQESQEFGRVVHVRIWNRTRRHTTATRHCRISRAVTRVDSVSVGG